MRLRYFLDEPDMVYVETFLAPGNVWERIKRAFLYLIGKDCKYGHFDEYIWFEGEVDKIQKVLHTFQMANALWKQKKEDSTKSSKES